MLAWEADLQEQRDLDTWHRAFTKSYKGILNTSLMEACLKVITKWYLTPSKLSTIFPSVSPLCLRVSDEGNHVTRMVLLSQNQKLLDQNLPKNFQDNRVLDSQVSSNSPAELPYP